MCRNAGHGEGAGRCPLLRAPCNLAQAAHPSLDLPICHLLLWQEAMEEKERALVAARAARMDLVKELDTMTVEMRKVQVRPRARIACIHSSLLLLCS